MLSERKKIGVPVVIPSVGWAWQVELWPPDSLASRSTILSPNLMEKHPHLCHQLPAWYHHFPEGGTLGLLETVHLLLQGPFSNPGKV